MALSLQERRRHGVLNAVLVFGLTLPIFVILGGLLEDISVRIDLSADGLSTLAEDTKRSLDELKEAGVAVQIVAFGHPVRQRERDAAVGGILRAMAASSPNIRAEFVSIDVDRMRALDLGVERYGAVVLRGNGRRIDLEATELVTDQGDFIAEASVRKALRRLMAPSIARVQFVTTGPGSFHAVEGVIDDLGYDVERVGLREAGEARPEADVLVVIANSAADETLVEPLVSEALVQGRSILFAAEPGSSAWRLLQVLGCVESSRAGL